MGRPDLLVVFIAKILTFLTEQVSNHQYLGSSSGFSIFSPKGIQWVNEKTGDKSFQQMIMEATSHDMKWSMWRQDVYGPLFEQRGKNRLPSKEVASILVQGETFRTNLSVLGSYV